MIFGAEEDGRREDAFESFYDPAIVEAVELEPEEGQHLRGSVKPDRSAFLVQGERCYPDRNKPVLTEREAVFGMADDLEKEFAAMPGMSELILCGPTQRQAAKNERPGMESKLLTAARSLPADQADRLDLFEPSLGYAEARDNLRYGAKGRREQRW